MAYNSYYPATYQPNYYGVAPYYTQGYTQTQNNQQMQGQNNAMTPQIQQSGFVLVQSENEARAYPVAPGNSITFKDETAPYCYVKTMGFSQLDRPIFERYRLVKEDSPLTEQNGAETASNKNDKDIEYALKTDLSAIWEEIDVLKDKLENAADKKAVKIRKHTERDDNDAE